MAQHVRQCISARSMPTSSAEQFAQSNDHCGRYGAIELLAADYIDEAKEERDERYIDAFGEGEKKNLFKLKAF